MDNLLLAAYALMAIGFVCLLAEPFFPTGGVLFFAAGALLVVGVLLAFAGGGPVGGLVGLVVALLGMPVAVVILFAIWPYTPLGQNLLQPGFGKEDTLAAMPELQELEGLRGRYGRAVSPLRPAGVVDFDGRRVDTLAEAGMVEPGTWVRCIEVRAGKVIVRPANPPRLEDLDLDADLT
jgi:membrane-bound serine protease (ClpP class)